MLGSDRDEPTEGEDSEVIRLFLEQKPFKGNSVLTDEGGQSTEVVLEFCKKQKPEVSNFSPARGFRDRGIGRGAARDEGCGGEIFEKSIQGRF